jgi:hypothetical protein
MNNTIDEPCSCAEHPKKCPVCHLINPGTAQTCDCGYSFKTHLRGKPITGSMPWDSPMQIGEFLSPNARLARLIRRILGGGFVVIGLAETYKFRFPPGDHIGWGLPRIRALFSFDGPLLLIIGALLISQVRGWIILLWIGCGLIAVPVVLAVLLVASALASSGDREILGFLWVTSITFLVLPGLVITAIGLWQRNAWTKAQRTAHERGTRSPNP